MINVEIRDPAQVVIPKILINVVKKASKEELAEVCGNIKRAKELIYLMSSQFLKSYNKAIKKEECCKININSTLLKRIVCCNYKPVLEFLIDNKIVEFEKSYRAEFYSRKYWFSDKTIEKGLVTAELKDTYILKKLTRSHANLIKKAEKNTIASYLLDVYKFTTLPTSEKLLIAGKEMVKEKKTNKKGLPYKLRGKKSKQYFLNNKAVRCIEDDIDLFNSLTKNGLKPPRIGSTKAGGRIYCSISMSPKWIRDEILIENEETIEIDYATLHPNLANKLWGESLSPITHNEVIKGLNKTKIEHLSYFNQDYYGFIGNELSKHYKQHHNKLYNSILNMKYEDIKTGKKNTVSYKLFAEEVKLMTRVVEEFKRNGIKALYVFDAMRVKVSDKDKAVEIMNKLAKQLNILTTAS